MSYKITKKNEGTTYYPAKHFDMRGIRLHNPEDVNQGAMTMSLSHFLPGGGTEYGCNAKESIYYVIKGEMTIEVEKGTDQEVITTLHEGDSFHCGPNTMKGLLNNGTETAQMLVVLVTP